MRPRTILLIDSDQSTRRQRVIMLLTDGFVVRAAEWVEDVELPFASPAPGLVLLGVKEPPDRSDSAYMLIRNAAPRQRIGFLVDDRHYLCELFVDGVLVRAREELAGDLIQSVEAMFETEFEASAKRACVGSWSMRLFSFRMKDGNCVIIYAKDETSAVAILNEMGVQSTPAGVRQITRFVANFALTDAGDLRTTLLDPGTLKEFAPDYPLLQAARTQSYADFGSSSTDNRSKPVLFDDSTRQHQKNWGQRDKDLVGYAVQQERERFSN